MNTIKREGNLQRIGLFLLLALLTLALVNCGESSSAEAVPTPSPTGAIHSHRYYKIQVVTNVAYGPMPGEVLDKCTPVGALTLRPGLVLIHGGGWANGDKSFYEGECQGMANIGFDAVTINYRLTSSGYRWPDQIGDAQLAVRWMRANATSLSLDPTRICALGDSAGAHLALLLDELNAIHSADVANRYPKISPQVECAVDQFAPTDLANLYTLGRLFVQRDIAALLDGDTPTQNPGLYSDASPVDHINALTGQVLIIQGTQDTTVLPIQSTELRQDLQKAGIPVRYISYTGGHEYQGLTFQRPIHLQVNRWLISVEDP
jgi:acetyl esterase/lipase